MNILYFKLFFWVLWLYLTSSFGLWWMKFYLKCPVNKLNSINDSQNWKINLKWRNQDILIVIIWFHKSRFQWIGVPVIFRLKLDGQIHLKASPSNLIISHIFWYWHVKKNLKRVRKNKFELQFSMVAFLPS